MKLKRFVITCIFTFTALSFANNGFKTDDNGFGTKNTSSNGFDIEKWKEEFGKDFKVEEWKNFINEIKKENLEENKQNAYEKSKKASNEVSKAIDVFNNASDIGINTAIGILQASQSIVAGIGSVQIMGTGADTSGATTTIGDIIKQLQHAQTTKNKLKEIKQQIEQHKDLSPEDLLTLNGLTKELNNVTGIINKSNSLYDSLRGEVCKKQPNNSFCKNTCSAADRKKGLCNVNNEIISNDVNKTYANDLINLLNGNVEGIESSEGKNKTNKILSMEDTVKKLKDSLNGINAKTTEQKLEKISTQLGILIALIEKDQEKNKLLAEYKLSIDKEKAEEEEKRLARKQKQIEENFKYIEDLKNSNKNISITKFAGDIYVK